MTKAKDLLYRSSQYKTVCVDECELHGYDYFWCYTPDGWDYCSPAPDITTRLEPCRENSPCGLYGESYYWCTYDWWGYWDYCGPVEDYMCNYKEFGLGGGKRRPEKQCPVTKQKFTPMNNGDKITTPNTKDLKNRVIEMIKGVNSKCLREKAGTICKDEKIRLDMQGIVKRNNKKYCNLQVQNMTYCNESSKSYTECLCAASKMTTEIRFTFLY